MFRMLIDCEYCICVDRTYDYFCNNHIKIKRKKNNRTIATKPIKSIVEFIRLLVKKKKIFVWDFSFPSHVFSIYLFVSFVLIHRHCWVCKWIWTWFHRWEHKREKNNDEKKISNVMQYWDCNYPEWVWYYQTKIDIVSLARFGVTKFFTIFYYNARQFCEYHHRRLLLPSPSPLPPPPPLL